MQSVHVRVQVFEMFAYAYEHASSVSTRSMFNIIEHGNHVKFVTSMKAKLAIACVAMKCVHGKRDNNIM